MRRSIVPSLPLQIVFPAVGDHKTVYHVTSRGISKIAMGSVLLQGQVLQNFLTLSLMRAKNNICGQCLDRGARKLTGENLKVVLAKFSTLSQALLQDVYNSWAIQTWPSLGLKTRAGFVLLA